MFLPQGTHSNQMRDPRLSVIIIDIWNAMRGAGFGCTRGPDESGKRGLVDDKPYYILSSQDFCGTLEGRRNSQQLGWHDLGFAGSAATLALLAE